MPQVSFKFLSRYTIAFAIPLCVACGGGSGDESALEQPVKTLNDDGHSAGSPATGERELLVSEQTASIKNITQCFCDKLYRSTLRFYHFEAQNTVLTIEIDNQTNAFTPVATVYLFEQSSTPELISRWINNQHSDGLYVEIAEPQASFLLAADAITITSQSFVKNETGNSGDTYATHNLEFTVSNQSQTGAYFLNGFADLATVHLQTSGPDI